MRQINVSLGQRSYPILIGPGLLGRAAERLSALPVKRQLFSKIGDIDPNDLYIGFAIITPNIRRIISSASTRFCARRTRSSPFWRSRTCCI